jgi:hypothetical protein
MKNKILCSLVLGFFLIQPAFMVWGGNFSYSVPIQNTGSKKYKGVQLSSKIINLANPYHSDLLLVNQKNEMVPYFINRFKEDSTQVVKYYELKQINSFVKDPYFFYDFTVDNPPKGDIQANSIEVTTRNENFVKKVSVLGSYDNTNWEKVQSGIIYQVDRSQKLNISFSGMKKYTNYRFQIDGLQERIDFTTVQLVFNQEIQKKEQFLETFTPSFTAMNAGKETMILIHGLKNITLFDLTIETADMFKRDFRFSGANVNKTLYQLIFKSNQYKDLTIPLPSYQEQGEDGVLIISNGDDKPIQITKITLRRLVEELVFDGSTATSFELKFGNPSITQPPTYDVASYKENVILEGYDLLKVGEINEIPASKPPVAPKPKDYKWLFNIIIVAVAILLGFVLLIRVKKE